MAEYDFKSPIDATVLICDSDEDINSSNDGAKDDIFKGTPSHKKPLNGSENVPLYKNKTKEPEVQTNTDPGYQYLAEELLKNDNERNNNPENPRCDKTIPSEDQCSNSNQIATTSLQDRLENPPGGGSQPPLPHNQSDINKKVNDCVQTLLNIVSEHLILTVKANIDYIVFTRTISDRTVLESARRQFWKAKYKLFDMSCSAVANIMLPKENDKDFIQKFIDDTVKKGQTKHLYFKHVDIAMACKEMFAWVKAQTEQPLLVELLNKENLSTAITNDTNFISEQVGCNKPNNASDSSYCIFSSGPTGREVTINVTSASTDIQNTLNEQNVPLRQAQPTSDELRKAMSTNYENHYSVLNTPLMQSALTPSHDLRPNMNSANYIRHYTGQQTLPMQSALASSYKLRTNANSINDISHYPEQNALSTQSVPNEKFKTNANLTSYKNHYPVQNMATRQNSLLEPSDQLKTNANSANYQSHVQNMKSKQRTHINKLRTNANSTNNISQDPLQNIPRQGILPPWRDVLKKNATSTNYMQEFEHFNHNYSYYHSINKYKSKQIQSSNARVQREIHHHSTHSPHTTRPPPSYYSTQTRHHDTVTPQNYSQNQVVNSTIWDVPVVQESVDVNRSLSRDSGFMSPLTCAPQDPMVKI